MTSDPGWSRAWSGAAWGLIPGVGVHRLRAKAGIEALRSTYLSFLAAVVLFQVVIAFLDLGHGDSSLGAPIAIAIVGLVTALAVVLIEAIRRRPLDASSVDALAQSYRTSFFLQMAAAEVVALAAFVLAFVTASKAVYPVGVAGSVLAFARAAPTRAAIERRQDEVRIAGSALSLLDALERSPPRR